MTATATSRPSARKLSRDGAPKTRGGARKATTATPTKPRGRGKPPSPTVRTGRIARLEGGGAARGPLKFPKNMTLEDLTREHSLLGRSIKQARKELESATASLAAAEQRHKEVAAAVAARLK